METGIPEENREETTDSDSDWENRLLCSDGNCIGVIGADGKCKECGKKYDATAPEESAPDIEDPTGEKEQSATAAESEQEEQSPVNSDWEDRVLCSDGNCIGVIGPDGKCKECGKPYEGRVASDE